VKYIKRSHVVVDVFVVGHELEVDEASLLARPEESRLTQAEKNERMNQQLKVREFRREKRQLTSQSLLTSFIEYLSKLF